MDATPTGSPRRGFFMSSRGGVSTTSTGAVSSYEETARAPAELDHLDHLDRGFFAPSGRYMDTSPFFEVMSKYEPVFCAI